MLEDATGRRNYSNRDLKEKQQVNLPRYTDPNLKSHSIRISSEELSKNNECCMKRKCTYKVVEKRLPILKWGRVYSIEKLLQDFVAGIAVGLTTIPQAIAYGTIAGLPAQYGLYSAFMGCFVYMFFGSCKDITIGPTSIMSLIVQTHVAGRNPEYAVLLCFITGCVIFAFGVLNLGFLIDFISFPVITGFTTAAVFTIGSSQIVSFLGIPEQAHAFLESWITVFKHIGEAKLWDSLLGFGSVLLLFLLKYLAKFGKRESDSKRSACSNCFAKFMWIFTLSRNALIVILGMAMAWIFDQYGMTPFRLTGPVDNGLPPFGFPPFSTVSEDGQTFNFVEMIKDLGVSMIFVSMIGILDIIVVGKAFSNGKTIDATQEMLALGLANIAGSFVKSMPITGAFSRSAVNNASGVQTPFGGVFTAILVLLALDFLTSAFYFIPKATLAAVIITAMIFMLDVNSIKQLWNTSKLDFFLFLLTAICCLFISLEYGIIIGICVNILFILYKAARPQIKMDRVKVLNQEVLHVALTQSVLYPAAEYILKAIIKECDRKDINGDRRLETVVVDGCNVNSIDSTVAKNLKVLADDLQVREKRVVFWRWNTSIESECRNLDLRFGDLFVHASTMQLAIGAWEVEPIHRILSIHL